MKLAVLTVLIIAALALAACSGGEPAANNAAPSNATITVMTPDPNATPPPETLATGKKLYQTNCAACHKEDGTGGKMEIEGKSINPDDLTSAKIKAFPDDKIYGYIYKGIEDEGMPAFKDKLSEAEIREVVRYLRADIQKMPEQLIKPVRSPE
ncbi:MAG: cytochrome c [Acidobacteriota bacterium]